MLTVETYTGNNPLDYTSAPVLTSANKTKRQTREQSNKQKRKATGTRNLAENLRLRIKPKHGTTNKEEKLCRSKQSGCCGLLKACLLYTSPSPRDRG